MLHECLVINLTVAYEDVIVTVKIFGPNLGLLKVIVLVKTPEWLVV